MSIYWEVYGKNTYYVETCQDLRNYQWSRAKSHSAPKSDSEFQTACATQLGHLLNPGRFASAKPWVTSHRAVASRRIVLSLGSAHELVLDVPEASTTEVDCHLGIITWVVGHVSRGQWFPLGFQLIFPLKLAHPSWILHIPLANNG